MAIEGWPIGSPELEILYLSSEQLQRRQQQWEHLQPVWKAQNKDEGKASPAFLLRLLLKIPISARLYFVMEEAPFH